MYLSYVPACQAVIRRNTSLPNVACVHVDWGDYALYVNPELASQQLVY